MKKMNIPEAIMDELKKAKKKIVKHHGEAVYERALSGVMTPHALYRLIKRPDRPLL